jgi:PAS domain S-box-containing protein
MGLSMLFTALGLFQYMQVFLASAIYIEIADGFYVSPGSSIMFTGSLFAVLLIYIKEDASETRKVIYALLSANIIMSILLYSFSFSVKNSIVYNQLNVFSKLFETNSWVLLIGTLTFFADSLLIILSYEFISKFISKLFLRISLTMIIVVSFDAICFSLIAFWNSENMKTILFSGLLSKVSVSIFYSAIFYIYLKYFDKDLYKSILPSFTDVFNSLTYRQKFELAKNEAYEADRATKLGEIKYQTLANISPVGIFKTSADGKTIYVNPKWCQISGLSQDEALNDGWLKAVYPQDRENLNSKWSSDVNKKHTSNAEYRFLRPDGSITWVLGQAIPELDINNEIIGYIGTITDITAIKLYEHALNEAKIKAEESDKLKTAFLQNISHEIRTPMNAIIGFSEMLNSEDVTYEKREEFVEIIIKSSKQLLSIISDIITISAIETMQEKVKINEVCVNSVISYLFDVFENQAKNKNISLKTNKTLTDLDSTIYTDNTKFIQIYSNLITNALKYTKEGFVEIGYNLNKNYLEFYVKDTGIGIEPAQYDLIFERFRQGKNSLEINPGTGLGLSISKAFVQLLGGKIWVESEFKKGSTFYFTIPYNKIIETKVVRKE